MTGAISRSQIDQLGERVRGGVLSADDLQLLDSYRLSFVPAYEHVVEDIRRELGLEPTGRPTKSTTSIADKLARVSIRLSQMQDVAGCRVVVSDLVAQDVVVSRLIGVFDRSTVFDRRETPSSGYRAVHVVVRSQDRAVEIQVRTAVQHLWAEFSEKLSDLVDIALKYGGGPVVLTDFLQRASKAGARIEYHEKLIHESSGRDHEIAEIAAIKHEFGEMLRAMIRDVRAWRGD